MDRAGQLGVERQFLLTRDLLVIGLCLLERGLVVLTDHHGVRLQVSEVITLDNPGLPDVRVVAVGRF